MEKTCRGVSVRRRLSNMTIGVVLVAFGMCGTALAAEDVAPCFLSSTSVVLPSPLIAWEEVEGATSYEITVEAVAESRFELIMASSIVRTKRFSTSESLLVFDDHMKTLSGIVVPWSDTLLWPAARYRYAVRCDDGTGTDIEVASGKFLKGNIETHSPDLEPKHPPLIFLHGFASDSEKTWSSPNLPDDIVWPLPAEIGDYAVSTIERPFFRSLTEWVEDSLSSVDLDLMDDTSPLQYFSSGDHIDSRECWTVDYPNADSIVLNALVLKAALKIVSDYGIFPDGNSGTADVICLSMGSVVVRYYLEATEQKTDSISIDRVVFLAGVHQGAELARYMELLFNLMSGLQLGEVQTPPCVEELKPENLPILLPIPSEWSDRWMGVVGHGFRLPLIELPDDASRYLVSAVDYYNSMASMVNHAYYGMDDDGDGMVACATAELGNGQNFYVRRYHSRVGHANWEDPAVGAEAEMVEAVKDFLK